MATRIRLALALAAVVVGLLLAVPGAQAATFCVGSPTNCPGIDYPAGALDEVLSNAALNSEPDVVRIGPGTYTPAEPAGFEFEDPTHGIEIRGEGPTETILQGTGAGGTALKLTGAGDFVSTVRDLGLRLSEDGGTPMGLVLADANATNVAVSAPAGLTAGVGVRLGGVSTRFAESRVTTPGITGIAATGEAVVGGSSIVADVGLHSTGGVLGLAHSTIETSGIGVASSAPMFAVDSIIRVSDGDGLEYGLLGTAAVEATHLTMVGIGSPTYGVRAYRLGGGSASQHLNNSTITGFENDLSAGADGFSQTSLEVAYSNYSTALVLAGGTITPGYGNIDVAPGFADPAKGDFHLRHDSPLIDAGRVIAGFPVATDLDLLPGNVDGHASGTPEPDIGAYEYQRGVPVAAISGPDTATVGHTIELSAEGSSDPDPADSLTYKWWFGDGTTATGQTASHAFATSGTHAVTLEVTDPTGQQRTVTKSISVQASVSGGGASATGDSVAPVISRLRTARGGKAVRFRLSEPASVMLRFTRIGTARPARRIRMSGRPGANELRLRGRLARALRPGSYRVRVSARDTAGNQARPRVARLVLLRRASPGA